MVRVVNVLIALATIISFAVLGSLLLSVAQLKVSVGDVTVEAVDATVKVQIPATVVNGGYYSVSDVNLETTVKDQAGALLAKGSTGPVTIPAYASRELTHVLILDVKSLKEEELKRLLFNDQTLQVEAKASAELRPFIAVSATALTPFEWGAPMKDFKVGKATFKPYNKTHDLVSIPVSFRNNSPYVSVEAEVEAGLLDLQGRLKGVGTLTIKARPKAAFNGTLNLLLKLSEGELEELLFKDFQLNYKLLLKILHRGVEAYSLSEPISYPWQAPLANLQVGAAQLSPYNATHLAFRVPVSFENHSPLIDLATELKAIIYNATSGLPQGAGLLPMNAPRRTSFQGFLEGYVLVPREALTSLLFKDRELNYRVNLEGEYEGVPIKLSLTVKRDWGALVKDLKLGKPEAKPYNATHFKLLIPMNFTNNSDFLNLEAKLTADFYDLDGKIIGVGIPQTITVPAKTSYQGLLQGLISLKALGRQYVAKLTFETAYGKALKEVVLVA